MLQRIRPFLPVVIIPLVVLILLLVWMLIMGLEDGSKLPGLSSVPEVEPPSLIPTGQPAPAVLTVGVDPRPVAGTPALSAAPATVQSQPEGPITGGQSPSPTLVFNGNDVSQLTDLATATAEIPFAATDDSLPTPTLAAFGDAFPIGYSTEGRPILAYQFKNGPRKVVLIGGIHGGYEWNTILLAYQMLEHFQQHPQEVPAAVTLYIIPSANPDGQYRITSQEGKFAPTDVTGDILAGRFNANNVDLNRNWDCQWSAEPVWRDQVVSGGTEPLSEPETIALREFFVKEQPDAVVFWHSKANGVFASGCPGVFQPSYDLAALYGFAAGYPIFERFDSYAITGDAGDWLATQGIPAISVELVSREGLDWEQNLAGVRAVLANHGIVPVE